MTLLVRGLVSVPKMLMLEALPTLLAKEELFVAWLTSASLACGTSGVSQRLAWYKYPVEIIVFIWCTCTLYSLDRLLLTKGNSGSSFLGYRVGSIRMIIKRESWRFCFNWERISSDALLKIVQCRLKMYKIRMKLQKKNRSIQSRFGKLNCPLLTGLL